MRVLVDRREVIPVPVPYNDLRSGALSWRGHIVATAWPSGSTRSLGKAFTKMLSAVCASDCIIHKAELLAAFSEVLDVIGDTESVTPIPVIQE